ncbi:hypothetical protein BT93_K0172 [Corymbia citriodora subsp. variegata]|nr:hypothetical protein BT93_K0172 [Corymbia citriodora subsp. variegata]
MEDSSAILCQISCLKDMLDQVNEEIELSIQITREMESEIVKCSEAEAALAAREAELTKLLYASQFELIGLATVTAESRKSVTSTEQELHSLRNKRDGIQERMIRKRCVEAQVLAIALKCINSEQWLLYSEKSRVCCLNIDDYSTTSDEKKTVLLETSFLATNQQLCATGNLVGNSTLQEIFLLKVWHLQKVPG